MAEREELKDIVDAACQLVRQAAGPRGTVALSPETAALVERMGTVRYVAPAPPPAPAAILAESEPDFGPEPCADKAAALADLAKEVRACTACPLAATRKNVVFGSGDADTKLVFVGEAPGFEEDVQGLPFVGRAGQLLTDIIEKGMNLKRGEVYICNVLKCRPPENRNPLPAEIDCCEPFLIRQLRIIRPRVICALGTFAAQTLLKTKTPIGQLRGKWHFYHGIPLRATYHPAYLLRNPNDKRKTWDDVREVLKVYRGEEEPKP